MTLFAPETDLAAAPTHDATACKGHTERHAGSPLHSYPLARPRNGILPYSVALTCNCPDPPWPAPCFLFLFLLLPPHCNCRCRPRCPLPSRLPARANFWSTASQGHLGATVTDHDHPCSSATRIFSHLEIPEPLRGSPYSPNSHHRLDLDSQRPLQPGNPESKVPRRPCPSVSPQLPYPPRLPAPPPKKLAWLAVHTALQQVRPRSDQYHLLHCLVGPGSSTKSPQSTTGGIVLEETVLVCTARQRTRSPAAASSATPGRSSSATHTLRVFPSQTLWPRKPRHDTSLLSLRD